MEALALVNTPESVWLDARPGINPIQMRSKETVNNHDTWNLANKSMLLWGINVARKEIKMDGYPLFTRYVLPVVKVYFKRRRITNSLDVPNSS